MRGIRMGLVIAAAMATPVSAYTIFKLELSPYQDGAHSFQNDNDAPGQSMFFQNAGVGTAPKPLGRYLSVAVPPGQPILGWFQSSAGGLPPEKLLSASWRGVYILKGQRLAVVLRADHFNEIAGIVARAGRLFLLAGGKEVDFGATQPSATYGFALSVDFADGWDKPRARATVRRLAPNGFALETLQSPEVAFQPSYPVQGAQRFLLAIEGNDGIKNGGYGINISDVEMSTGLDLKLPPVPLPNPHCHGTDKPPFKIVCDGPGK